MIVKVAIDLSLDRLFSYEVPGELQGKLAVGQLLCVPFSSRQVNAFAMEISAGDEASVEGRQLRPIGKIIDEEPFFTPALLKLVGQIAAYTASPIESVLRAAVPAAVLKPNAKARELLFVEPSREPFAAALTSRQRWICEQVVRLGGGWMRQLCRELGTTPSTLRVLGQKGALVITVQARRRDPLCAAKIRPSRPLELNAEQRAALDTVLASELPVLLHGVTGSGKTEVYLQAIAAVLENGGGAIVMVPEIALTPQTVQRFASRFGDQVAVLHSALSDGERYDEWHRIRSGQARVVVGPRSAVFAPVRNLALIVVDEEHETSYKQEDAPRYHARDAAVMRGRIEHARVVLGSATPSLETWLNVRKGKYTLATIARRAGAGRLPSVAIVDMAEGGVERRGAIFSPRLLEAIALRLDRGEQTILFLNRRGYSRSVVCECGYVMTCPDCSAPYTYHRADNCLRCHICGGWRTVPRECPECKSITLSYRGIGTQRAEAALAKCFPHARILRMDADSTSRKQSHDDILGVFRRGEAQILLGTQMIAKGLDFPNVTLVGVLNADSSLNMPDIRAAERTYQLLSQVAGRAGRAELPGEVFIQTYDPSSPVIVAAARGDFVAFAEEELKIRRELDFPPYLRMALVNLRSKNAKLVSEWSEMYAKSLKQVKGLIVGDAIPSAIEKADGWYRWQIMLRSPSSAVIVRAWRWIIAVRPAPRELRVFLDVDAYNMV